MNWSRYYGQNFLIDLKVTKKIIELSEIKSCENVCEMGTGRGILTEYLCKNANIVKSFEIDNILYNKIKFLSAKYSNLEIINEDIFKYNKSLEFDVFVSNIPYSKSKEIFSWLVTKKFERAIIMVQDEFSHKIRSKPGDKNYRAISAITQYCFDIEPLFKVNKKSFFPQPKVDSEVIKLQSKDSIISKDTIAKIQFIFSFKNKNINKLIKKLKLNTNFDNIDLKIKDMDPEKIIRFSQLI